MDRRKERISGEVAADLRQLSQDTLARIARLNATHGELESVLDDLRHEHRDLATECDRGRQRRHGLDERTKALEERLERLDEQIGAVQQQLALLKRRRAEADGRAERLARESSRLQLELLATRERIDTARGALTSGQHALARVCDKLSSHRAGRPGEDNDG